MDFRAGNKEILGVPNGTVVMNSQDTLSVAYIDPNGKRHIFNITAQNLVMMISHEGSGSAMLVRPSTGLQFVQG